jgi:hypothetical protein
VRSYLNDDIGIGNVNTCVTNSGKDNGVDLGAISKVVNDVLSFSLANFSADVRHAQPCSILFDSKDVIAEYHDLVASGLMEPYKVVASHELVWIVEVQSLSDVVVGTVLVILLIKVGGHLTPNFNALNSSKIPAILQVNPVSFVQFWSNQEVKVVNLAIFSYQCSCEPKFAMGLDPFSNLTKVLSWHDLNLIEQHQTPIVALDEVHHFVSCLSSVT